MHKISTRMVFVNGKQPWFSLPLPPPPPSIPQQNFISFWCSNARLKCMGCALLQNQPENKLLIGGKRQKKSASEARVTNLSFPFLATSKPSPRLLQNLPTSEVGFNNKLLFDTPKEKEELIENTRQKLMLVPPHLHSV